ncbi:MAG: hypothetical protein IT422_12920 [Pirellulaceae bacterium]|nr:hypothetical protein [Pirellulaceae bacterium]
MVPSCCRSSHLELLARCLGSAVPRR